MADHLDPWLLASMYPILVPFVQSLSEMTSPPLFPLRIQVRGEASLIQVEVKTLLSGSGATKKAAFRGAPPGSRFQIWILPLGRPPPPLPFPPLAGGRPLWLGNLLLPQPPGDNVFSFIITCFSPIT